MVDEQKKGTPDKPPFTECRVDITAKFNEMPKQVQESPQAAEITLVSADGQYIEFSIKPKTWRKFKSNVDAILKNNPDAQWTGAAGGKLAGRTAKGIRLESVGIQVFEKKPKPPKAESV